MVYVGDFVPVMKATLSTGETGYSGLHYTSFPEDARKTLATRQPELAAKLQPAALHNGATYTCTGITMTRWDIAGVEKLAAPSGATTASGN